MSKQIKYVRAENLSEEKRKRHNLPSSGTVALVVAVNSPVERTYEKFPEKNFFRFLKAKVGEKVGVTKNNTGGKDLFLHSV